MPHTRDNEERIAIYRPMVDCPSMEELTLNKDEWEYFSRNRSDFYEGCILVDEDGDVWFLCKNLKEIQVNW